MFKEGNGITMFRKMSWKRRYFVLKGHLLYYYRTFEDYNEGKKNIKKAIELYGAKLESGEETKFYLHAYYVFFNIISFKMIILLENGYLDVIQ